MMDSNEAIRNFRDFLLQYNKISESCFSHCVDNLCDRDLSQDECRCVDMCTKKHVSVNHKVMQVYMEIQPLIVNKRIEEMNKQQTALNQTQKQELASNEKSAILDEKTIQGKPTGSEKAIVNETQTQTGIVEVLEPDKKIAITKD